MLFAIILDNRVAGCGRDEGDAIAIGSDVPTHKAILLWPGTVPINRQTVARALFYLVCVSVGISGGVSTCSFLAVFGNIEHQ